MEEILALAKKVTDEAEVFLVSSEETTVQFETNRLKHMQSKQSTIVALRIIKNGRIGYATATHLEDRQRIVDMALETAQFGMTAKFEFPAAASHPGVRVFDSAVKAVSLEEMVGLGEELISRVKQHTLDVICQAGVEKAANSVRIINSRGGQARFNQTVFSISLWGNLIRGTDMLFVGESQSSGHPILKSDTIAKEIIRQLELARNQAAAPTKILPVIFTPNGVASTMITPLTAAFNGKMVLEGASPLANKLGQLVFDKKFSLSDDATINYRPASRPCDDEGVPSQRTTLIEEGIVRHFLYDLQTAALAGTQSTGSAGRTRGSLPSPSPSSFVITPGTTTLKEMVSDIKDGLVIEELMGAEQGNILGGDFSGNVLLGYKIENGKIVGRVKNTMVSGNVYQLLKEITAVGSDAKWVGSSLKTPSLYCPRLSVAAKE